MEDARTSTSSQRLASTSDTLIESPEADIAAIAVRPESLPTGSSRDIPVHHELISSSEELHGARKDRGTFEWLDNHVSQRTSPTGKSLVEKPKHVTRASEEESGPRQGQHPSGSSPSIHQQASTSTSAKQAKATPKTNHKGKQKEKGKAKTKWNKPYPQNYRIPKKQKTAMDNVFNMARTLMEFKNKEEERLNQSFPKK
ncbi:hypothetical protein O181_095150 [Austropuccinia psidii MF-1]|uniref:Uncharacterized protein n=1 Tax=Austropuccinia psidii MF-1 TaxID=1389203 RepID=A0A9Q3J3A7_9BASI|nr:hypothetical protein [Austropuccinia psidii MF-1]